MTKITFELNDKLDEKFRKTIADSKGLHRGVIQEAIEEAIESWIMEQAKKKRGMNEE
jgi:predicted transcriptional regulator